METVTIAGAAYVFVLFLLSMLLKRKLGNSTVNSFMLSTVVGLVLLVFGIGLFIAVDFASKTVFIALYVLVLSLSFWLAFTQARTSSGGGVKVGVSTVIAILIFMALTLPIVDYSIFACNGGEPFLWECTD